MTRQKASRRFFLQAATGVYASFAASLSAAQSPDRYWQAIRDQFPFHEDKVPMNAANLCPSPTAVGLRVAELTRDIDVDCSFQNRDKFVELLEESRKKVAVQMGVTPDEIALVRNTSEANNTINNGLALERGAKIVLWEENHPTNNVAWDVRAKRFGYEVVRVVTPAAPKTKQDLVRPFEEAMEGGAAVLSVTHASNVSGVKLPVAELGRLAHDRGAHYHVDGAQTWGALDVDLREMGCDSYSSSAHKWFCGPKEVGLLYVRRERIESIWPQVVAPGWGSGAETELVGARKFESMGQRDDAALSAIGPTVDFHRTIGADRVEAHMMELAGRLKKGLAELGAKLSTPEPDEISAGVVIMQVPAKNRAELMERLYAEHGIAGSTSGGLRLCPHVYNTAEHVDRAIAGVKALKGLWKA